MTPVREVGLHRISKLRPRLITFALAAMLAIALAACGGQTQGTSIQTVAAITQDQVVVPTQTVVISQGPLGEDPNAELETTPTPIIVTPRPTKIAYDIFTRASLSPDAKWIALEVNIFPKMGGELFYTQFKVVRANGEVQWMLVDEWSNWGLGYSTPEPLAWSKDGQYFYFTNVSIPDGCGGFINGSDLHRVSLLDGTVTQVVPRITQWLSLSPDDTTLAYLGDPGVVLRDLATGEERGISLDLNAQDWTAGALVWSPDATRLMLTIWKNHCGVADSMTWSIVRLDVATLSPTTVIRDSTDWLVTVKWPEPDKVLLSDRDGRKWWMNAETGELSVAEDVD